MTQLLLQLPEIKRLTPPSPDQAADCVTCLGCLAWPRVTHMKASKHDYWPAQYLVACDVCTREPSSGATRAAAVAEWNRRNARLEPD